MVESSLPLRDMPSQYPLADRKNNATLFGDRDELRRRNIAACWMRPAQQRLKAYDIAGPDVLLRLVHQPQLIARDRIAEIVFEKTAVMDRAPNDASKNR